MGLGNFCEEIGALLLGRLCITVHGGPMVEVKLLGTPRDLAMKRSRNELLGIRSIGMALLYGN